MNDPEVLIVGAGPVGLALALELRRFGIRFRIIEKKAQRSTTSKALGLQPRVAEVFAILGMGEAFAARGFSDVRALNFHSGTRKLLRIELRTPIGQAGREACQPTLLIIPQSETEEILERTLEARGHVVERCRELVGFEQQTDLVRALVRGEDGQTESITTQFLVSCEGAHSIVRKQAGFSFAGTTMPMRFVLADVTIPWALPENEVQVWFHRDGVLGALPFGEQKWRLIIECADAGAEPPEEVTLELVQQIVSDRVARADMRLRDPVWLSDFRINARMVDRFRDRRIFVAGDAAHIHSPLGGQGIATGIQDASNLAWKLAAVLRHHAPDSLLDTYDEERKPVARTVLRGTTAASNVVFGMNPFVRFVRERLVFPILNTALVQRQLFARVSQLEIRYRGSLAVGNQKRRLRAGDRAPDVVFVRRGEKKSLFELLGEFGMLALLGPAATNQAIIDSLGALNIQAVVVCPEDLHDVYSDFARLYGAEGAFICLIRPDGHIGLFQVPAEAASLADYLKKIRPAEAVEKAFASCY